MKVVKILGIIILILLVMIMIIGGLIIRSVARRWIPEYNGEIIIPGMKQEVTVYRDGYGIPHILAQNESDLYQAVGYCMAQDRLWQMDLLRRVCTGRLAEILGADLVETDLLLRALRIPEKSRKIMEKLEPEILASSEAFAQGVNAFIEAHRKKLPPEFAILRYRPEPWQPEHSLHLIGYMAWDLTSAWDTEIFLDKIRREFGEEKQRILLPDFNRHKTEAYPAFAVESSENGIRLSLQDHTRILQDLGLVIFNGSNNWAVSGSKSESGSPILANDMHLGINVPGIWYQVHQNIEGRLDVTGVAVPGQPFVVAGHNQDIAWGFTNVMVDGMDFYLEKINPENPNQYELNGEWKSLTVRHEKIPVRGGKTVEETLKFTHRGPDISRFRETDGRFVSMSWIGNEDSNEIKTIYLLNRAGNWEEFKTAMKGFRSVCQNAVYADRAGNIGLYCAAGAPIRKKGDPRTLLPGWTDEYDWEGMVPFEELPHLYNPENGAVSSANNRSAGEDYPHYIGHWYSQSFRIDRIREMLTEQEKISADDICRMQADQVSSLAKQTKSVIIRHAEKIPALSSREKEALDILRSWDGNMEAASAGAAIFETFHSRLIENVFSDELGEHLYSRFLSRGLLVRYAFFNLMTQEKSSWCDNAATPDKVESFSETAQISFRDTVARIADRLGGHPKDWQWGKLHTLTLAHPLGTVKWLNRLFRFNRGPYEVGGSYHTVCPYKYPFDRPFQSDYGASHRHIFPVDDWDAALTIIPTGISGIPASPHYCDQAELYVNNLYHPDYFSRKLIQDSAKYKMTIKGK